MERRGADVVCVEFHPGRRRSTWAPTYRSTTGRGLAEQGDSLLPLHNGFWRGRGAPLARPGAPRRRDEPVEADRHVRRGDVASVLEQTSTTRSWSCGCARSGRARRSVITDLDATCAHRRRDRGARARAVPDTEPVTPFTRWKLRPRFSRCCSASSASTRSSPRTTTTATSWPTRSVTSPWSATAGQGDLGLRAGRLKRRPVPPGSPARHPRK